MLLTFDKPVYNDPELTEEATGPFHISSSTILPYGIYYTPDTEYTGISKNTKGETMYTVTFNSTDNVAPHTDDSTINTTSLSLGAVYV